MIDVLSFILSAIDGGGYLVIMLVDLYLILWQQRRMDRGKHRRWARRTCAQMFGLIGEFFGWMIPRTALWLCALAMWPIMGADNWVISFYWLYVGVSDTVDYITGGEDPPWRRWAKSLSERVKLVIQPPPKPAIQV